MDASAQAASMAATSPPPLAWMHVPKTGTSFGHAVHVPCPAGAAAGSRLLLTAPIPPQTVQVAMPGDARPGSEVEFALPSPRNAAETLQPAASSRRIDSLKNRNCQHCVQYSQPRKKPSATDGKSILLLLLCSRSGVLDAPRSRQLLE